MGEKGLFQRLKSTLSTAWASETSWPESRVGVIGWKIPQRKIRGAGVPAKLTKQESYSRQARGTRHQLMLEEEEPDQIWRVQDSG